MKISLNRIHSPKGRATLVREWLRLLADRGVDPLKLEKELPEKRASLRTLIARTRNSWHKRKGEYDFSHEVKEAMSGCLACKACTTQCPIKIDVPEFRSRFLQLYHTRYLRPVRDHLVATVETYALLMARAPKTFNFFINQPVVRNLAKKHIGMVDLPLLSAPSLQQQLVGHPSANMTLEQLERMSAEQKAKTVLVVQDPFTSYYDARVVADFIRLAEKLGRRPVLLPFSPNGKAQHIKGFLNRFAKTAKKTSEFLNRIAAFGDADGGRRSGRWFCVIATNTNWALGEQRGDFHVLLVNEWLAQEINARLSVEVSGEPCTFFGHVRKSRLYPARLRSGPPSLPILARSWKMSA
ncbi:FAD-binding protein [Salmonella enterica subsp. enterica]|nr:FAD-binding protein [Salmonella enterica subsp. enterica]